MEIRTKLLTGKDPSLHAAMTRLIQTAPAGTDTLCHRNLECVGWVDTERGFSPRERTVLLKSVMKNHKVVSGSLPSLTVTSEALGCNAPSALSSTCLWLPSQGSRASRIHVETSGNSRHSLLLATRHPLSWCVPAASLLMAKRDVLSMNYAAGYKPGPCSLRGSLSRQVQQGTGKAHGFLWDSCYT